jgi:hypothetical protein
MTNVAAPVLTPCMHRSLKPVPCRIRSMQERATEEHANAPTGCSGSCSHQDAHVAQLCIICEDTMGSRVL